MTIIIDRFNIFSILLSIFPFNTRFAQYFYSCILSWIVDLWNSYRIDIVSFFFKHLKRNIHSGSLNSHTKFNTSTNIYKLFTSYIFSQYFHCIDANIFFKFLASFKKNSNRRFVNWRIEHSTDCLQSITFFSEFCCFHNLIISFCIYID